MRFLKAYGSWRGSIKRAWASLKKRYGIEDLIVKDLRTWFNHVLKSRYRYSTRVLSSYLGHTPRVKKDHYDPISLDLIQQKLSAVLPGGSVTQFATKLL